MTRSPLLTAGAAGVCAVVVLAGCSPSKKTAGAPSPTPAVVTSTSLPSESASDSQFDVTLVPESPSPSPSEAASTAVSAASSPPAAASSSAPSPATSSPAVASPSPSGAPIVAGRQFAFIKKVDLGAHSLTYDQAQFLTGAAAEKAAAEDKQQLDTDYYIRNVNKRLRTAPIAPTAAVLGSIAMTGQVELNPVTLDALMTFVGDDNNSFIGFWITIDKTGQITKIEEQYLP